jgi:hypothetical protein
MPKFTDWLPTPARPFRKPVSSVPSLLSRASRPRGTPFTVVKAPPMRILPSLCNNAVRTRALAPDRPLKNRRSSEPSEFNRAMRFRRIPSTAVKSPPMIIFPSGCSMIVSISSEAPRLDWKLKSRSPGAAAVRITLTARVTEQVTTGKERGILSNAPLCRRQHSIPRQCEQENPAVQFLWHAIPTSRDLRPGRLLHPDISRLNSEPARNNGI